jgi:hypothetical protein
MVRKIKADAVPRKANFFLSLVNQYFIFLKLARRKNKPARNRAKCMTEPCILQDGERRRLGRLLARNNSR